MKNAAKMLVLGTLSFLGAGLLLSGCKSAPELTQANAQALIQAKYDQMPAAGAQILVDLDGMARGATAKYWARTKLYPNNYWADFTLTPEGKKVVKLKNGGDLIKWQPLNAGDKNYTIEVVTVATAPLKVTDVSDPQDEVGGTKSASYVVTVSVEGLPNDLQAMADGPGNRLSRRHVATFALDAGAWKLQAVN